MPSNWQKLHAPIVLSLSVAHIPSDLQPLLAECLSPKEATRASSFRHAADRQSYGTAHALLRLCLSAILDADPLSFDFRLGAYGKPELADPKGRDIRFNISHSRGLVVVGLAHASEIGVDTESMDRFDVMTQNAVMRALSPQERTALSTLDDAGLRARLIDLWTLKEAVVKATGRGLTQPLSSFSVDPANLSVAGLDDDWRLAMWMTGHHRIAAASPAFAHQPMHAAVRLEKQGTRVKIRIE